MSYFDLIPCKFRSIGLRNYLGDRCLEGKYTMSTRLSVYGDKCMIDYISDGLGVRLNFEI